jgi:hypothetical protein
MPTGYRGGATFKGIFFKPDRNYSDVYAISGMSHIRQVYKLVVFSFENVFVILEKCYFVNL